MASFTHPARTRPPAPEPLRLDKWLWASRFYKTRSLARQAIEAGHVRVNGTPAKPSRAARIGDVLEIRRGAQPVECTVRALSHLRGPAKTAQTLYEETPASIARRQIWADERDTRNDVSRPGGVRPTKRQRRSLDRWRGEGTNERN